MRKTIRLFEKRGDTSIRVDAEITEAGDLRMSGQDIGEAPELFYGDSDYEYWVTVRPEHKDRLLLALIEQAFSGHVSAVKEFREFLEFRGIPCEPGSWM